VSETREEAISLLEDGQSAVRGLIARLPESALTRPGLGGGDWSPKDLIGHLASWEEHALAALEAWDRDEGAPIDRETYTRGTNAVNAEAVAARASLTVEEVWHQADITHASLIDRIARMADSRWENPATSRGRKPLGHRLGQILGSAAGGFRHAEAHLKSLTAFVETTN
jgi:hypothetical protein